MHADTIHRGRAHVWDGWWHPSLHCVVGSSRYPRKEGGDTIDLAVAPQTAMRHKDILDMTDEQCEDAFQRTMFGFDALRGLVNSIVISKRKGWEKNLGSSEEAE
jgi:hypothetical protein